MSAMSAVVHADAALGLLEWSPAAARSNTAIPRSVLSCTCRGTGRPSLVCWAAMPRRITVQSAGG
eukprot:7166383-Alexandrium_andersonii.AAC.1